VEVVEVRKFQAFQEIAAEALGSRLEILGADGADVAANQFMQLADIDSGTGHVDPHRVAVGDDALLLLVVDEAPELRQAPAQRPSRIVGNVPQELADVLASEAARLQAQVGQQRTGLLGGGQRQRLAVSQHLEIAQEPQFELRHIRFSRETGTSTIGAAGTYPQEPEKTTVASTLASSLWLQDFIPCSTTKIFRRPPCPAVQKSWT
jgi:hypothetical protein